MPADDGPNIVFPSIMEFEESVAKYPNLKPGIEDFHGYGVAAKVETALQHA